MPKSKNISKFSIFNKMELDKHHNDDLIIRFLKTYGRPAPPCLISFACGLSSTKTSQVLKSLVRHRILKIVYKRKVPFYYFNDGYISQKKVEPNE
jgi:hypothetical protein